MNQQPRAAAADGGDDDFRSALRAEPASRQAGRSRPRPRRARRPRPGHRRHRLQVRGQIPIHEFLDRDGNVTVQEGDDDRRLLRRHRQASTAASLLSRAKAEQFKVWHDIEEAFKSDGAVEGTIVGKVKGGLKVDVGVPAFLPGSHADMRPTRNLDRYIGQRGQLRDSQVQPRPRQRRRLAPRRARAGARRSCKERR